MQGCNRIALALFPGALLSCFAVDWAAAGTVFQFVGTGVLSPPEGIPAILTPYSAQIEFDTAAVIAGQATVSDVQSLTITAGPVLSDKSNIASSAYAGYVAFSQDGSRIIEFRRVKQDPNDQASENSWLLSGDNLLGEIEIRSDLFWPAGYIGTNTSTDPFVSVKIEGFWSSQPGINESFPVLPVSDQSPFQFELSLSDSDQLGITDPLYFDPPITTGYEYKVNHGGLAFATVTMPSSVADADGFELLVWDGENYVPRGTLLPGETFDLLGVNPEGVMMFQILGIDPDLALDPENPLAFPTGLTFAGAPGEVDFSMTPKVIPVPASLLLLLSGVGGLGIMAIRPLRRI